MKHWHWLLVGLFFNISYIPSITPIRGYLTSEPSSTRLSAELKHRQTCRDIHDMLNTLSAERAYREYQNYLSNYQVLLDAHPTVDEVHYFEATGQLPERIRKLEIEKAHQREYEHLRANVSFVNPYTSLSSCEREYCMHYSEYEFAYLFGVPVLEDLFSNKHVAVRRRMLEQFNYYQFPAFYALLQKFPEFNESIHALAYRIHTDQYFHDQLAQVQGPLQALLTAAKQAFTDLFSDHGGRHYVCTLICDTARRLPRQLPPPQKPPQQSAPQQQQAPHTSYTQNYTLTPLTQRFLQDLTISENTVTTLYGSSENHRIHVQEINILKQTADIRYLYSYGDHEVTTLTTHIGTFTALTNQLNRAGQLTFAEHMLEVCASLLDVTKIRIHKFIRGGSKEACAIAQEGYNMLYSLSCLGGKVLKGTLSPLESYYLTKTALHNAAQHAYQFLSNLEFCSPDSPLARLYDPERGSLAAQELMDEIHTTFTQYSQYYLTMTAEDTGRTAVRGIYNTILAPKLTGYIFSCFGSLASKTSQQLRNIPALKKLNLHALSRNTRQVLFSRLGTEAQFIGAMSEIIEDAVTLERTLITYESAMKAVFLEIEQKFKQQPPKYMCEAVRYYFGPHVNEAKTALDEILTLQKKYNNVHPYVDKKLASCISCKKKIDISHAFIKPKAKNGRLYDFAGFHINYNNFLSRAPHIKLQDLEYNTTGIARAKIIVGGIEKKMPTTLYPISWNVEKRILKVFEAADNIISILGQTNEKITVIGETVEGIKIEMTIIKATGEIISDYPKWA